VDVFANYSTETQSLLAESNDCRYFCSILTLLSPMPSGTSPSMLPKTNVSPQS
jgi:hypothetical protein